MFMSRKKRLQSAFSKGVTSGSVPEQMSGLAPVSLGAPLSWAQEDREDGFVDAGHGGCPVKDGRCAAGTRFAAGGADAHAPALVLKLVDAELSDQAAQHAGRVVASGHQHGAVMQAHIWRRIYRPVR